MIVVVAWVLLTLVGAMLLLITLSELYSFVLFLIVFILMTTECEFVMVLCSIFILHCFKIPKEIIHTIV